MSTNPRSLATRSARGSSIGRGPGGGERSVPATHRAEHNLRPGNLRGCRGDLFRGSQGRCLFAIRQPIGCGVVLYQCSTPPPVTARPPFVGLAYPGRFGAILCGWANCIIGGFLLAPLLYISSLPDWVAVLFARNELPLILPFPSLTKHIQAQDLPHFTFGKDFKRPAADLAIGRESLAWVACVHHQIETLAAIRALNGFGDFHDLRIEEHPPEQLNLQ